MLALDLGTTTGWALRSRDGQIAHGFVNFKPQRFEGGGMRYLRFKRWLSEITGAVGEIHSVYFEEVRRHSGVDAAHVYPLTWLPSLAAGNTLQISGHSYRVREITAIGDGSERRASLSRL